ncbi:Uncharacterized protein Fot_22465 [Forsythia ovata]|uniref:PA domain-containing protein n=1 Tax=Forsythia ovata TaxID=205694 RepID=A0ABD1UXT5_9LAMI
MIFSLILYVTLGFLLFSSSLKFKKFTPPSCPAIGCLISFYKNRYRLLDWYTQLLSESKTQTIVVQRFGAPRTVVTANPNNVEYIPKAKVRGKMVVCKRGVNGSAEKGQIVKEAGGAAMILVNTEINLEEDSVDVHVLLATLIGFDESIHLESYMNSTRRPRAKIIFGGTVIGKSRAPAVAEFSSRGPSFTDPAILKPDMILSTQNSEPHQPSSSGNAPNSQSSLPKIIVGSLALGSVLMEQPVKYDEAQNGDKNKHELPDQSTSIQDSEWKKTISETSLQESDISISNANSANKNIETHSEMSPAEHSITTEGDSKFQAIDTVESMQENIDRVQEKDLPSSPPVNMSSDDVTNKPTEESFDMKSPELKPDEEQHKAIEITPTLIYALLDIRKLEKDGANDLLLRFLGAGLDDEWLETW